VVSGDEPVAIDMPTLHTHNITNVGGDELVTIFWANDHFQPDAPDTYPEAVEPLRAGAAI
jgi:UDP-2-acetamido-2,6-beta-L-arabino-hexul-4-ose reductase